MIVVYAVIWLGANIAEQIIRDRYNYLRDKKLAARLRRNSLYRCLAYTVILIIFTLFLEEAANWIITYL